MCGMRWPLMYLGLAFLVVGAPLLLGVRLLLLDGAKQIKAPLVGGLVSMGIGGIAFGTSFVVSGC
jgi:hypothetical protein